MQVLNFGHPLTGAQLEKLVALCDGQTLDVTPVKVQMDQERSFVDQVRAIVDSVGWTGEQWQTHPFVVVPPGLAAVACVLLAEIHGRSGYFPSIVRVKPIGGTPSMFEPAEVLTLASVREDARVRRHAS